MKKNYLNRFLSLIFSLAFLNINIISQVQQEWLQGYSGQGSLPDEGYSVVCDKLGNVYVSGYTTVAVQNWDYLTIKYNSDGIQQWIKTYNGPGNGMDYSISMAIDDSGNVYVTGGSSGTGTGLDITTIKYNTNGVQQWLNTYSGYTNHDDSPYAIAVDDSGNSYITGWSYQNNSNFDYVTIKYNSAGVQQWISFYNGTANSEDYGYAVAVDNLGNVYVTGESQGNGSFSDCATVKYNSQGIQQWVQRHNGSGNGNDFGHAIAVDTSGNIFVTGESAETGTGSDFTIIKYNPDGIQQWIKFYDGPAHSTDAGYFVKAYKSESIYVSGFSTGSGTGHDFTTIKYDENGIQQWIRRFNGTAGGNDEATWLAIDTAENIYVTGFTTVNGTGSDYAIIKYDSGGAQQWIQTYNGNANNEDIAWSITVDNFGNLIVTGGSTNSSNGKDCLTIKYSQPIGIKPISIYIPAHYLLYQNYPNPFNPKTKIKFDIPAVGQRHAFDVRLAIYDILGKQIAVLDNESAIGGLKAGTYEAEWDASNYPSGVYFYKLMTDEYSETKKMVLLK